MIRRSSARTPPFVLIGLLLILLILGYNYWTLSSQNSDLQEDIERLQTDIKINAVKQEQSEKKNAALQNQVHDMDELSSKLRKQVLVDEDSLKKSDNLNKKKDYEVTKLKSEKGDLEERLESMTQDLEEKEIDVNKAKEENSHLISQVDDAIKAIAEKDSQINDLKRQLEQAQDEVAALRREQIAAAAAQLPQAAMNMIPNVQYKDANNEVQKRDVPLEQANLDYKKDVNAYNQVDTAQRNDHLVQPNIQVPDNVAAAAVEAQHQVIEAPGEAIQGQQELPQPNVQQQQPQPPQIMDAGNLDAAIDEEVNEIEEDLNDDQDEEGNEIKEDNKNAKQLFDTQEKEENGALEIPNAAVVADDDLDNNNEQINVIERQPQQQYYDHNMEKNIRNLERNHLIK